MGNLGDILSKKIKSLGIEKQVEAADVCERATKEIAKHIPNEDFEVISYKEGVLKVWCDSACAKAEIEALIRNKRCHDDLKRVSFSPLRRRTQ